MPFDRLTFFLPGLRDILEILIVAFLFYRFLLFMAGTRAIQILFGSILLALAYLAAFVLQFVADVVTV